jgi:hypothetical protein
MVRPLRWLLLFCACAAFAQDKVPQASLVVGIPSMKDGVKGALEVKDGSFYFKPSSGVAAQIPVNSILDVSIDNDSKRAIGGPIGTLSMFGPYGSGRFLSLFRTKLDVLTISYRDENNALHGVIFAMPVGAAKSYKKDLLAAGAKSSTPLPEDKPESAEKKPPAKEVKPAAEKKEVTK